MQLPPTPTPYPAAPADPPAALYFSDLLGSPPIHLGSFSDEHQAKQLMCRRMWSMDTDRSLIAGDYAIVLNRTGDQLSLWNVTLDRAPTLDGVVIPARQTESWLYGTGVPTPAGLIAPRGLAIADLNGPIPDLVCSGRSVPVVAARRFQR